MKKGDMIVLPEGIYHRFTLDDVNFVKVSLLTHGHNLACPKCCQGLVDWHSVAIFDARCMLVRVCNSQLCYTQLAAAECEPKTHHSLHCSFSVDVVANMFDSNWLCRQCGCLWVSLYGHPTIAHKMTCRQERNM